MLKTPGVRATFGGSDIEKVHAVVARITFRSQNVQNTPVSDHFWKSLAHGFPVSGTAGPQAFEPMLPNLGSTCS